MRTAFWYLVHRHEIHCGLHLVNCHLRFKSFAFPIPDDTILVAHNHQRCNAHHPTTLRRAMGESVCTIRMDPGPGDGSAVLKLMRIRADRREVATSVMHCELLTEREARDLIMTLKLAAMLKRRTRRKKNIRSKAAYLGCFVGPVDVHNLHVKRLQIQQKTLALHISRFPPLLPPWCAAGTAHREDRLLATWALQECGKGGSPHFCSKTFPYHFNMRPKHQDTAAD